MCLSKSTLLLGQHTKFLINVVGIILYDRVAGTVKNECAFQLGRKVPVTGTAYVIWAIQQ